MAMITATWRIELGDPAADGIVLLDWGEFMNDEPRLDRSQTNDIVAPLRASGKVIYPRGDVHHILSFTRIKIFTDDSAARDFLLAHTAAIPYDSFDCTIRKASYGGAPTFILANAVVDQAGFNARCEANWFIADYKIIGGLLTIPPTSSEASFFEMEDASGHILTEPGDKIQTEH